MAMSYVEQKRRKDAAAIAPTPEEEQARIDQIRKDHENKLRAEEADALRREREARGVVFIKRVIDPHERPNIQTVTSSWEPLTPSMCTEDALHGKGGACGLDVAKERGFKTGWDEVPEDMMYGDMTMRERLLLDLRQHKSTRHAVSAGNANVRTAEQMRAARAQRPLPEGFIENPRL
jgi:hypothetical protein